ncbi:hypothetical protein IPM19_02945 [bacterium]|nr:MAG: hypothetical protein IPM19_02945 [bacterium]
MKNELSFPKSLQTANITSLEKNLKTKPESFWQKRGEQRALKLFHEMAKRVPAYKDFLKKHKVNPAKIKSAADFALVPTIDKNNYLRKYPLKQLCWDGVLSKQQSVYAATSGTTGEPFYFPRTHEQSRQYALTAELYLRNNFQIHKKSTLYIDGFAMGAWIGGLFTYEAVQILQQKGYDISIITPGVNSKEIIKAMRQLGDKYDQVILGGYPPFVKDTIDQGLSEGLNWKKYNLGIIFSAEGFTEAFRDYVAKQAGLKNIYTSTLNHYGTVDQGTHSHETPLSILVRRLSNKNKKFKAKLFSGIAENDAALERQPTLTQYLPELFYFENDNGNLYCSAFSGLPLFRYDLKDRGGIMSAKEVMAKAKDCGIDLDKEIRTAKLKDTVWNLPFVYVYERSDMVVSWYGGNIYPEHVREAHLTKATNKHTTGKFAMRITYDKKHNPVLEVNTELKPGAKLSKKFIATLRDTLIKVLLKKNSEYRVLHSNFSKKMVPVVKLWQHQSAPHFAGGGKQKWTIK